MTMIRSGLQHGRNDSLKGQRRKEQEEVRQDGEGRWKGMKLYTQNNRTALYRADKAAWQQMRLHKADLDVVTYHEVQLRGRDNVVCTQMYNGEGREYQQVRAQGVPRLVRGGLSVVQDRKVGGKARRAVYDVATQHGREVAINCHVPHGKRVKKYLAQLRMEYVRALERGLVIMVGYFGYDPQRRGNETEVDQEARLFVDEMRLQDVSYNGAPGPSHYLLPEESMQPRMDALYASPRWVRGVTAGYMVGPEEMQDRKGHCAMLVTVDVKVGEPGDEDDEGQDSVKEGVNPPPPVRWLEEGDSNRWQQWKQQVHVKMRQGCHVHWAMRRAGNVCGFSRPLKELQTQPKLQRLVATLRKRQQEEVEARAQAEGAVWKEEVARAKKRAHAARGAVEDEHERVYQKVVAEHEGYMDRVVPYKSLRYIQELAEAGQPQEIRAVRLQDCRVTDNKREVLEEVAESFRQQHNQEQQALSETTRRMVRALLRVFADEQCDAIHRRRVTLGEIIEAVPALRRKTCPGVDQLVAEAYENLCAPELDGLAGRVTEVLRTGEPPVDSGGKVRLLYKKGGHLRPENWRPICCAVTETRLVWMVVFGRIQRRLYAAGVISDNMSVSVPDRSTQEASFLYDMYLDDEDLEAFMASVNVNGAFPNMPHGLIEEVLRQLGLPHSDFIAESLPTRRCTF